VGVGSGAGAVAAESSMMGGAAWGGGVVLGADTVGDGTSSDEDEALEADGTAHWAGGAALDDGATLPAARSAGTRRRSLGDHT
jgi:hypothetical protein